VKVTISELRQIIREELGKFDPKKTMFVPPVKQPNIAPPLAKRKVMDMKIEDLLKDMSPEDQKTLMSLLAKKDLT